MKLTVGSDNLLAFKQLLGNLELPVEDRWRWRTDFQKNSQLNDNVIQPLYDEYDHLGYPVLVSIAPLFPVLGSELAKLLSLIEQGQIYLTTTEKELEEYHWLVMMPNAQTINSLQKITKFVLSDFLWGIVIDDELNGNLDNPSCTVLLDSLVTLADIDKAVKHHLLLNFASKSASLKFKSPFADLSNHLKGGN